MSEIRLVIHGAGGRMGRRLVALANEDSELRVVAALESDAHPELGSDAGQLAGVGSIGVPLSSTLEVSADCVIDFSASEVASRVVNLCSERQLPLVLATTGLSDAQKEQVAGLAEQVPVVWAPNMSPAVNLTMKLATIAAQALKDYLGGTDVEIIERHHRFKKDAPSGTALRFGELISTVMGQTQVTHGRQGHVGERPRQEIGYHALRVGDNVGEHTVVFGTLGESIELSVRASNRDCYAVGALTAAKYIVRQQPAIHTMVDVLGL
ncbi:MAG: 4-hydroxy-tetrahydrodipicolinate reductase [Planctomycetota bacterium]